MHTQAVPVFFQLREKKNQYVRIDFLISTSAIVIAIIRLFTVSHGSYSALPAQITFQSC